MYKLSVGEASKTWILMCKSRTMEYFDLATDLCGFCTHPFLSLKVCRTMVPVSVLMGKHISLLSKAPMSLQIPVKVHPASHTFHLHHPVAFAVGGLDVLDGYRTTILMHRICAT